MPPTLYSPDLALNHSEAFHCDEVQALAIGETISKSCLRSCATHLQLSQDRSYREGTLATLTR